MTQNTFFIRVKYPNRDDVIRTVTNGASAACEVFLKAKAHYETTKERVFIGLYDNKNALIIGEKINEPTTKE